MRTTLLIAASLIVLAGCGSDRPAPDAPPQPTGVARTSPSPRAGTPFPDSVGGSLHAGTTYTTRVFAPHMQITPAAGKWVAEIGEIATDYDLAMRGIHGQAILAFHDVSRVFDPVTGGRDPGDEVPAPTDFAEWLERHPHLAVSNVRHVRRMGLEGVRLDVRAVSHPPRVPDECGRHANRCVPLIYDGTDMIFYTYGTVESRARFYVLELPSGKQLVVEEYFENPSDVKAHQATLEQTLRSAKLV